MHYSLFLHLDVMWICHLRGASLPSKFDIMGLLVYFMAVDKYPWSEFMWTRVVRLEPYFYYCSRHACTVIELIACFRRTGALIYPSRAMSSEFSLH